MRKFSQKFVLQKFLLSNILNRLLGRYPNTYGFTKGLVEQLVYDFSHKIPTAVARPPISKLFHTLFYKHTLKTISE